MKHINLLLGGLLLSGAVMAQKPDAGTPMSLEGQVGWNANTLTFNSPSIRFRYFFADNIAARLTVGLSNTKYTELFYEGPNVTQGASGEYITRSNAWNIGLGGEYHFTGTDRLSPYVGLDIILGGAKQRTEGTDTDGTMYIADYQEESVRPVSLFGFNIVAGTDFYFSEHFYIGAEMGFGLQALKQGEGESSVTSGGITVSTAIQPEEKFSNIGNNVMGAFRLGWRF